MDGVKEIFRREPENWLGSEEDSDEEDDDEEDEWDDDGQDDDEDEQGDGKPEDKRPLHTESTRKSKRKDKEPLGVDETPASPSSTSTAPTFDDTPDSSTIAPEDNLPHPRPFESRRDFFQRTGNEWQEALMTGLRWKGIQPETLNVKEIKTRAFEMSEEKWWDCREEITALEDEQEAAGIGEVVALGEREGGAGGGVGRRR
ncbi:hypothetical protein EYC84_002677 [Monilinia fructicola]|uniref:DUF4110 domain-containing protein n=1 Tax=Monilinia fructicola TaxID=38448 RepID=A0A5M9JU69_MONFR|nr:hypothetical protein EYC84_002677 [Monilinia fructicola]